MSQVSISVPTGKRARRTSTVTSKKKARANPIYSKKNYYTFGLARVGRGIPEKLSVVLRYVDHALPAVAAGANGYDTWGTNCLFDPYIAAGGHQPYGFDQYMALYNKYHVVSAKCKVIYTLYTEPAGTTSPCVVGLFVDDDATNANTAETKQEFQGRKSYKVLGPSCTQATLYSTWKAKTKFGGDIIAQDSLSGTNAANPSEYSGFQLYWRNDSAIGINLHYVIDIEYECLFTERKDVGPS